MLAPTAPGIAMASCRQCSTPGTSLLSFAVPAARWRELRASMPRAAEVRRWRNCERIPVCVPSPEAILWAQHGRLSDPMCVMMNITHTAAGRPGVGAAPRRRHGPQPARRLVPQGAKLNLRDDAERVLLTGCEPDRRIAVALQQRVGGIADRGHDPAGQFVAAEKSPRHQKPAPQ